MRIMNMASREHSTVFTAVAIDMTVIEQVLPAADRRHRSLGAMYWFDSSDLVNTTEQRASGIIEHRS